MNRAVFIIAFSAALAGGLFAAAPPEKINVASEISALKGKDMGKKLAAASRLGRAKNKAATAALVAAVRSEKDGFARARIIGALAETADKGVVGELTSILRGDSSPEARYAAAYSLTYIHDASAVPVLTEIFLNPDEPPGLRMRCANALTYYFPSDGIYGTFVRGLSDPLSAIRIQAVTSVSFDWDTKRAVVALKKSAAQDPDESVRAAALERLETLGAKMEK